MERRAGFFGVLDVETFDAAVFDALELATFLVPFAEEAFGLTAGLVVFLGATLTFFSAAFKLPFLG